MSIQRLTLLLFLLVAFLVFGSIIEQVSGESYEAFLQQTIFTPLRLLDTGYAQKTTQPAIGYLDAVSPADTAEASVAYAGGGLYSTVEDLYRWDQALYSEAFVR